MELMTKENGKWKRAVKIYGNDKPSIATYRATKIKQEKIPTTQFEKDMRLIETIISKGELYIKLNHVLKLFRKHIRKNGGMF